MKSMSRCKPAKTCTSWHQSWRKKRPPSADSPTQKIWRFFPGRKLERLNFQHPFLDRKILGVLADYVTMDTGTGVVHTAPSHGAEDFITGMKYGLDATSNVDEKGILRNGLPEYNGQYVFKANPLIIELLRVARSAAACGQDSSTRIRTAGAATIP